MRIERGPQKDEGAVTIIVAFSLMALLFLLALSIDINALRADIRDEQATSDFAALAAGQDLDPTLSYDPVSACESAWTYALANLEGIQDPGSPCASGFAVLAASGCDVTTAAQPVSGAAGDYVITLTTPIPDDHALMGSRVDAEVDGWSCERFGVTVTLARENVFGGITGTPDSETKASAVVRAFALGEVGEFASLIVLDRSGCDVLVASGQGTVVVDEHVDASTGDVTPGIITVDTRGTSCANNEDFAMDAKGNQNSRICVGYLNPGPASVRHEPSVPEGECVPNGVLFSYGLRAGFGPDIESHDECDEGQGQPQPSCTTVRLAPNPVGGSLVTRSPGDHTYNCKFSYAVHTPGGPLQDPAEEIDPCDADDEAPYIDDLVGALGGSGTPGGGVSWNEFPNTSMHAGRKCKNDSQGTPLVFPAGNWWINCPSNNNNAGFAPGVDIEFTDPGYIVVENGLALGGGDWLTVGSPSSADAVMLLREGDFTAGAQSSLEVWHTAIYLQDGNISSGASGGSPQTPREGHFGEPACSDGIDNDGDGQTDTADADCAEAIEATGGDCDDLIDNDGDGLTDRDDPTCQVREGPIGDSTCSDSLDNDGNGSSDREEAECQGIRRLIAPIEGPDQCTSYATLPPASCFEDLILWSNSSEPHKLGGQGLLDLQGVFFTPNATPFELDGGSDQLLNRAQFLSYRISVSGQGRITMTPNPEFNLSADITGGGLIR